MLMSRKTILYACVLLAVAPFFFVGGATSIDSLPRIAVQDLGHVLFFAFATMLALASLPVLRRRNRWLVLVWLSAAALVLGASIERLQTGIGRDRDYGDIYRNVLGVWTAWFLFVRPRVKGLRQAQVVTALLLCGEFARVANAGYLEHRLARQRPLIADFEEKGEVTKWAENAERSAEFSSHGRWSLHVALSPGRYSGSAPELFPRDWRGWDYLALDLYNPEATDLDLTLIIGDRQHYRDGFQYHDRYNRRLVAEPGWNSFRLPLAEIADAPITRTMNLGEIVTFGIFASNLPHQRTLYVDHVRLE